MGLPSDRSRLRIFLLMGQSNMAGYGCVLPENPWQPGDRDPMPGVLALGGQCTLKFSLPRGWTRWRPAAHPLHLNQRSAGFGLALPFAARLREAMPETMVGLIPCAWGGAPIDRLGPGSPLYKNAVRRARIAEKSGTLAGVLWHQGESDAESDALAPAHAGKLAGLMGSLRGDLGVPELPFLIGDLGDFGDEKRKAASVARRVMVREGLRRVAEEDPHAAFVESRGLGGVDSVHFGREALVEFGRRYAERFLGM
ncbi:sialate O-acetylesterase [Luteolibacter sp. Populi]|uniref:sialate O-acetylesterase n=1 Tax=Luteolibacter sp. Populi TaxID=3230487 RepID=UPI0034654CB0